MIFNYHINKDTLTIISGPHGVMSTYVKLLTSCGNPDLLNLADYDLVPEVMATLTETQKHGEKVVYADRVEYPAIEKDQADYDAELESKRSMMVVSPWQIRKALNVTGKRGAIKSAMATAAIDTQDGWEYATSFQRLNPLVVGLGAALGLTDVELDELFLLAQTL